MKGHIKGGEEQSRTLSPHQLMPENGEIFGNASLGQGSRNEWMLNRDGRSAFVMGPPGKNRNFA